MKHKILILALVLTMVLGLAANVQAKTLYDEIEEPAIGGKYYLCATVDGVDYYYRVTNSTFSESAQKELFLISAAVNEILDITVNAFATDDNEVAKSIEPLEETIDDMVMILKDRHTKRLKNGVCSISTGLVFMESLTYFERAADQCSSIAVMMLARSNRAILQNHYDYLREIHAGNDAAYNAEKNRRREQYITPLKQINF